MEPAHSVNKVIRLFMRVSVGVLMLQIAVGLIEHMF